MHSLSAKRSKKFTVLWPCKVLYGPSLLTLAVDPVAVAVLEAIVLALHLIAAPA
jgi:hypothetical protein